jgi:hypothetical protein
LKQPVVLKVYKLDKLEAVRQFEQSQIVIGKSSDVQLDLQDESVALLHAMIEERDGEYFVSDLGSQNGTFLNGNRILEEKVNSGDELKLGNFRIQFFIGVPKPAAPPKIGAAGPAKPVEPPAAVMFSSTVTEGPVSNASATTAKPTAPPIPPAIPSDMPSETKETKDAKEKRGVIVPPMKPAGSPQTAPSQGTPKGSAVGGLAAGSAQPGLPPPAKKVQGSPAQALISSKHKTFAPPSPFKDLREVIKPHKGSVIEVIVAWQDRILSSNHFAEKGSVFLSSADDADVVVPILSSQSKYELLKIGTQVSVCLTPEMTGELVRDAETITFPELTRHGKLRNVGTHFELDLKQGEMIRIGLHDNLISIYIRYVADTPKPLVAPLLDMTSSEVTGVILALAISAILALYMNIYTPSPLLDDEAKVEEPIRKAIVTFNPPKKVEMETKSEPVPEKKVVQIKEKPRQTPAPSVEKKGDPGKAGEVAPNPQAPKNNKLGSARPGGAIKTAPKEGASAKSEKPDPSKVGLLGVFSSKGTQSKLDKAYSGSGELQGMADAATGYAGNADNRDGENLGTKLKDTAGGKGSSTVGIAGIGTQGRGTGNTGYGSGGIGQKGSVQINVSGQDGDFTGGMDREAIRRVIRDHIREIRNCYERELQRSPDLYGKLVIEWDIEEGGQVSRTETKSNALGNANVANCIASRLKQWKFPDPPKGVVGRVSYPFVFTSQ